MKSNHRAAAKAPSKDSDWEEQEAALFGSSFQRNNQDKKKIASITTQKTVSKLTNGARTLGNDIRSKMNGTVMDGRQNGKPSPSVRRPANGQVSSRPAAAAAARPVPPSNNAPSSSTTSSLFPTSGISNSFLSNLNQQIRRSPLSPPTCVVCSSFLVGRYQYHPFFPNEKACSSHLNIGKCTSCHRFEPLVHNNDPTREFADLMDHNRKLCPSCLRTVIADSADANPVWMEIVQYFSTNLRLFDGLDHEDGYDIQTKMERIPILIVGHDGLNDPCIQGTAHHNPNDTSSSSTTTSTTTRGLCMYEYRTNPMGGQLREFLHHGIHSSRSKPIFDTVSNALGRISGSNATITAVLCVKGLPKDLCASVLAHEGTHAYLKLHPSFQHSNNHNQKMPIQVEEGLCQLMAFMYLHHLDFVQTFNNYGGEPEPDYLDKDGITPSNRKLRQYFRYCIETDTSEVYGDGFRMAAKAFRALGGGMEGGGGSSAMRDLLEYVLIHHAFPPL